MLIIQARMICQTWDRIIIIKFISFNTAWKVSKYGVFNDSYFPVFGLSNSQVMFGYFVANNIKK